VEIVIANHFCNSITMALELQRLNLQLENLKVVLEDAIRNNKPFFKQTRIVKQISDVEHLIEKRKKFLESQEARS